MTTCVKCGREFPEDASRCPGCGRFNPAAAGLYQTSAVLISAEGSERVYRSVEDVPPPLRRRLIQSTNGRHARTILITDRKGRRMIDKALVSLHGPGQRLQAMARAGEDGDPLAWLTPPRRRWAAAVVFLIALAVILAAFMIHWK